MKILVTGGAGFIGSHLVIKLIEGGHEVVVVDNLNQYYDPKLKVDRLKQFEDKIHFEKVDITDFDSLKNVFEKHKFDKIAHLAAQAGVRYSITHPHVYTQTNFLGTGYLYDLAVKHEVKDIVFASTSSVYGESPNTPFRESEPADRPVSIYAATKRACELLGASYHKLYGLNVTNLRFFTVYGPWGRPDMALFKFVDSILKGEAIDVYNNGDMKRDFTYVDDIVEGFIAALDKPMGYEIINLGHGEPVYLTNFIKVIEKELGKDAKMNFLPMQPGDVPVTYADNRKAKELLNFEPKVGIDEGVARFIGWYKDYHKLV